MPRGRRLAGHCRVRPEKLVGGIDTVERYEIAPAVPDVDRRRPHRRVHPIDDATDLAARPEDVRRMVVAVDEPSRRLRRRALRALEQLLPGSAPPPPRP